jgi:hypothetical protein
MYNKYSRLTEIHRQHGADANLQYVEVIDNTEGAQANTADEGKPRCN